MVTGAGQGIGQAIALALAERGAQVIATDLALPHETARKIGPAMRALTRYAAVGIEDTGLGLSDFGVLEILLHKGPLPVNTIGPMVDLTPGSISIAVDRLVAKGLVSRVESGEDRREIGRAHV